MINKKLTFGIVIGTRGFFNSKLALEVRIILLSKLGKMGYEIVILPKDETPTGVIETLEDAKKCAKLFSKNRKIIDGIIVALPNFGNEISIINAIKLSTLDVPILVQASDDYIDKVDLENRRDSFCGKLSVCNNFYQNGIPFTDTTEHTIDIESEIFTRDINFFEKVCRVVNGLRKARIGVIGTRPAAFQTVRLSEKILQASGITVIPVDLSEILFDAIKLADSDNVVKEKAEELKSYGYIPEYIKKEKILKQSKLSVIVNRWVEDNDIDAVAMQCWSSIQTNYGCAACATLSMMSEKFIPSACEADIAGAVSMYALILASGNQSAIVDWNNNYGGDREKCVIAHCSNYPKSFFSEDIEISNLDVLGKTLGEDSCFGAVKGKVAPGPMTFFRMDTDDLNGIARSYLGEGEFTNDSFRIAGGAAVCKIQNLRQLLKYLCQNGFEHHVAMTRGNYADIVEHALEKYLKWAVMRHR